MARNADVDPARDEVIEAVPNPWPRRCEIVGASIIAAMIITTLWRAWGWWDDSLAFGGASFPGDSVSTADRLRSAAIALSPEGAVLALVGLVVTVVACIATGKNESRCWLGKVTVRAAGVWGAVLAVAGLIMAWDVQFNDSIRAFIGTNDTQLHFLVTAAVGMVMLWLAATSAADEITPTTASNEPPGDAVTEIVLEQYGGSI